MTCCMDTKATFLNTGRGRGPQTGGLSRFTKTMKVCRCALEKRASLSLYFRIKHAFNTQHVLLSTTTLK